ncbi:MAG: GH32 C-terminal domain-containing protein, partial [Clostridiales bacterium]|nr:GH32 C-terminal domain-containing protein [Clostridiales bacterium]
YMIVGTTENMTGGALHMYTSTDMRNWVRRGYLYSASKLEYPDLTDKWECSIMLPVHNDAGRVKYALMVLPQNPEPNYTELYYWLGDFDKNAFRFVPDDPTPRLLDYGRNIYNGQTGFCYRTEADVAAGKTYEQGRTVLFALAQGRELPDKGWMHNVTVPLELRLSDDGKELRYAPIEELANLYGDALAEKAESVSVQEINALLANVHTDCAEIRFTMTVQNEQSGFVAGLDVRADMTRQDGEYTRIKLFEDEQEGRAMAVERTATSKLSLSLMDTLSRGVGEQKTFAVTVYLDRSMLEVYVNDTFSFTTRVYPTRSTADGLRFVAENCDVTVSG